MLPREQGITQTTMCFFLLQNSLRLPALPHHKEDLGEAPNCVVHIVNANHHKADHRPKPCSLPAGHQPTKTAYIPLSIIHIDQTRQQSYHITAKSCNLVESSRFASSIAARSWTSFQVTHAVLLQRALQTRLHVLHLRRHVAACTDHLTQQISHHHPQHVSYSSGDTAAAGHTRQSKLLQPQGQGQSCKVPSYLQRAGY